MFTVVRTIVNPLDITLEAGPSGPVMRLSGEADVTTAEQLREAVEAQLSSGARRLTIDLSGLRFIDASAVYVLLRAQRLFERTGAVLELQDPHPNVACSLGVLGVDEILTVRLKGRNA